MEPKEPPPSYDEAASSSSSKGIPLATRRSMEDENRPLPAGWVRQYDAAEHHQFFVDTNVDPPRSIWHHPHDDEQYLSTISPAERARIQRQSQGQGHADDGENSDDEHHTHYAHGELPPREASNTNKHKFGRKLKDKIMRSTHEEREAKRRQREEEERRLSEQHQIYRQAMAKAAQTGEPQLLGRDRQGKDVYIEPPYGAGGGYGGYGDGAYGYDPYSQGAYGRPNARYVRPSDPYSRPYGSRYGRHGGYGGMGGMGMGMPLMMGMGGGMMMGGLMGGGMGGMGGGGL